MNTNSVNFFSNNSSGNILEATSLILAVWDIAYPGNVGNTIRLGHNIGAKKVIFVNDKPDFKMSKIKKTGGFSVVQMNWEFVLPEGLSALLDSGYQLVALETCVGSKSIFSVPLPPKCILLAGNESYGIPDDWIRKSCGSVHIPMPGGCKSMNVSHALAVAAFEWYRQHSR
ncbi:MAG: methyltransferase [Draconibacterium sp.]|nr:MAG: methyltransferase [Draconibacterium sp.]